MLSFTSVDAGVHYVYDDISEACSRLEEGAPTWRDVHLKISRVLPYFQKFKSNFATYLTLRILVICQFRAQMICALSHEKFSAAVKESHFFFSF